MNFDDIELDTIVDVFFVPAETIGTTAKLDNPAPTGNPEVDHFSHVRVSVLNEYRSEVLRRPSHPPIRNSLG